MQTRGLEIRASENFGPHTKYFPFVEGEAYFPLPLATADDDLIYPVFWLERLAKAFGNAPEFVNCYRAHRVRLEGGKLGRYGEWGRCRDTQPSYLNFATGVSGVIYPPALLAALKAGGRRFQACCPRADDIWLHAVAIRSGFRIRQIQAQPLHFPLIPLTQGGSLNRHNQRQNGNDPQIQDTYQSADIERLLEEEASVAVR